MLYRQCYTVFNGSVIRMELSEILKSIRAELNITQTDLAKAVHVSFSTVNRWENKKVIPNRMALALILDFCEKRNVSKELTNGIRLLNKIGSDI